MELPSGCIVLGLWSTNFWLLFCKLLRGLLKWIYSGLYGSLGKKRMTMGVVDAIYKLKYFIFCRQKNTGKMAIAQGKDRENTGNLILIWAWQPWDLFNDVTLHQEAACDPTSWRNNWFGTSNSLNAFCYICRYLGSTRRYVTIATTPYLLPALHGWANQNSDHKHVCSARSLW